MIYMSLFFEFFKIGLFTFGGAYAAIPLIQESVISNGWMSEELFSNMVAISESTPGPIMINAATYVGNTQARVIGAICATLGVVLPSFIIVLLITIVFHKFIKNRKVQMVLRGIKPCLMGVILATGSFMIYSLVFPNRRIESIEIVSIGILVVLISVSCIYKKFKKQSISPIVLIILSAVMGCVLY